MRLPEHLHPGHPDPMGALARDGGVNFAVFSEHAQRLELCIFDADGVRELRRYELHGPDDGVFHGFLPGGGPGLVRGRGRKTGRFYRARLNGAEAGHGQHSR